MTNPSCAGKRDIICGTSDLQGLGWVLSETQDVAQHLINPHKRRLDPFFMLSFN